MTIRIAHGPRWGEPQPTVRKRKPSFLAVYLDRHFLEDGDFKRLKNDLSRFLRQGLQPEDQILLATANEELEVLEPFTTDRQRVIDQVAQLTGAPDGGKLPGDFRAPAPRFAQRAKRPLDRHDFLWSQ